MKKKRIYYKYLRMNPVYASELYSNGKISFEKYQMAFYSKFLSIGWKEEKLIELIYG